MPTTIPEKIQKILADINAAGNASLTRLTVLKKWFEYPGRLPAFGLWIARGAAGRKGKMKGKAGALLDEARALLGAAATRESYFQKINWSAAKSLHGRARGFHDDYQKQQWGPVRIIHCWPLLLVEEGLALYLGMTKSPSDGYKLAADWTKNYDSRYGAGLNGPSRGKLKELVQFILTIEAIQEDQSRKGGG